MHERAQTTWAELQAERGVPIRSVVNDTPRPVAVYDTATGDLETVDQPGVAEDLPFVTSTRSPPDANADGAAIGSPGVLSGNLLQVPVNVPINVCGNTVDVIAL